MTIEKTYHASGAPLERRVSRLLEAEKYLRDEADFNRSWVDGRRGSNNGQHEEYKARRIAAAEKREAWADAISDAIEIMAANVELTSPPTTAGATEK